MSIVRAVIIGAMLLIPATASAQTHVTTIGDSITYAGPYPTKLGELLGSGYVIENDGWSGATMNKKGDKTYWEVGLSYRVATFIKDGGADVVIMLGTNDSKAWNWAYKDRFVADCQAMVEHWRSWGNKVWLNTVPPVRLSPAPCCGIDGNVIANEINPLIKQCAANTGATLVDVYAAAMAGGYLSNLSSDGVHPTPTGAYIISQAVYGAMMADAGPPVIDAGSDAGEDAGVDAGPHLICADLSEADAGIIRIGCNASGGGMTRFWLWMPIPLLAGAFVVRGRRRNSGAS